LSGGKIYIPVRQGNGAVTLDERQFGVGLKFHPTVLEGGRINLKLTAEASELSQTGAALSTADGLSSLIPTISTRQVDTTVQLGDGQSLAIAGLIRQSVSQSLSRFPGLGDLPVLGALFRSTAFQKDQTELVFVVTPRLVQPLRAALLPTDVHVAPSRQDAVLGGKAEGTPTPAPPRQADVPMPAPPARAQAIPSEQGSQQ
jgi:pilus assembly protein CpaC